MNFLRRRKNDGDVPRGPVNNFFGTVGSPIRMGKFDRPVEKRDRPVGGGHVKEDTHWMRQTPRQGAAQAKQEQANAAAARPRYRRYSIEGPSALAAVAAAAAAAPAPANPGAGQGQAHGQAQPRPRHRRRISLDGLPGQRRSPSPSDAPAQHARRPGVKPTSPPPAPAQARASNVIDTQASVNEDAATLDVKQKLVLHKEIQRHQRQQAAAAAANPRAQPKNDILSVHDSSEDSEDDGKEDVATVKRGARGRREPTEHETPAEAGGQLNLADAKKAKIPLFRSAWFNFAGAEEKPAAAAAAQPAQQAAKPVEEPAATPAAQRHSSVASRGHSKDIVFSEIALGRMIGEGAFGKVYEGKWRGKGVAVKVLVCQDLRSDIVSEFQSEIEIMSVLRHPNICRLLGACMEPPNRALVVELMQRGSLWGVLRTHKRTLTMDMRTKFVYDTAKGMAYLHHFERPILHRDLKSPNLLADKNYNVKLADFGLARVKAHIQTMTGNCGTVQWMAPEVLANSKYTEKADVFSFGIVIWEIMTGECPYDGVNQIQVALGVLNRNLRPNMPKDCPPFFSKLMKACWNRQPELRPTFAHIVTAFRNHQSTLSDTQETSSAAGAANAAVLAGLGRA